MGETAIYNAGLRPHLPGMQDDWDHFAVIGWLVSQGRLQPGCDEIVAALGRKLVEAGAPVSRIRLAVTLLHPLVRAISSSWEQKSGAAQRIEVFHGDSNTSYEGSPIQLVSENGQTVRYRLEDDLSEQDNIVLHELKAEGFTDYFGLPLPFSDGARAIMMYSTERPGGFTDGDIEKLSTLAMVLAPVIEVYRARQISQAVAKAYLGPRTGRKVLEGQITRGDIETIDAAIFISDLRGWTRMNQTLPPEQTVALANRYFEQIAEAIDAHGGEILKFLGDGVLAIFPGDASHACSQALAAAQQAQSQAAGLNFGIGLHFGQVLYGNIGSKERIDFTVLGQAVNLASRIEGQCADTEEPILYSDRFARAIRTRSRIATECPLKGLDMPQTIYAPDYGDDGMSQQTPEAVPSLP